MPHVNGAPYSEKAPLLFWLIHAGWFVFGVNDVWPRVLEVLVGGAQLVLLSVMARRLFPDRPWVAKAAPWMLLSLSYAFLFGLQIMYDVLLAAWALAALLCLTPKAQRAEPRWLLFGLCIGLGLLTKGPVMLLHVIFPWLLGPLWSDWAAQHRARWYGRGVLSLLLGVGDAAGLGPAGRLQRRRGVPAAAVLHPDRRRAWSTAWPRAGPAEPRPAVLVVSAGDAGADVSAQRLAARHAALAMLRRPLEPGMRFALCWLVPAFITFSLISGKQLYYPLPELGGGCLLLAGAIALLRERHPRLASNRLAGHLAAGRRRHRARRVAVRAAQSWSPATICTANGSTTRSAYSRYFSVVFLLLGGLLLLRGRGEMRRLAFAGLIGALAFNTLFTLTAWRNYDLARPRSCSAPPNRRSIARSATSATTTASSTSPAG